ncbi:MAG TPA: hypothetical protein VMV68_03250 [Spirochaetia bacterium]|nr:hypothetical protein [Spirochaetia bacterium]
MKYARIAVLFILGVVMGSPLFAEAAFRDNDHIRKQLSDIIFAPTSEVLSSPTAVFPDPAQGTTVRFDVVRQDGDFYLLFTNQDNASFPIDSPGSYIIKRSERDGSFVQVKIFLDGGPNSFIRIFPMGERTRMNVYLYGYPMYRDLVLPISFKQVLTDPFSTIMELTRSSVDWSTIFADRPLPEDAVVAGMVNTIRKSLPLLSDHADGAMSSQGQFVYIKTLEALSHGGFNCSGFGKWVIDGLYEPRTGSLISIEELKRKHLDLRGNEWSDRYEKERDPYFGLDWTRNLSLAVARLGDPNATPTSSDVTDVPFFRYVPNVGYPIADLKFILYELAVANPGYFYLGAVNREYGSNPVLREFTHVVVLFPYFDSHGQFKTAVMERNLETGTESLAQRFPDDFIQLERVAASTDFSPPMP